MFVKGLRKFLYAGALLALAPFIANGAEPIPAPCAPVPAPAACAPATCKVKVLECVDEPFECTKTVYKPVTKQETYTAYKCETVNETKTKQVTEYQKVCETVNETRTIVKRVPCWEEKTEMVSHWKCVKVTENVQKTHYSHHWECVEVPTISLFGGHKKLRQQLRPMRHRLLDALHEDEEEIGLRQVRGMRTGLQDQARQRVRAGLQEGLHLQVRDRNLRCASCEDEVRPGLQDGDLHRMP